MLGEVLRRDASGDAALPDRVRRRQPRRSAGARAPLRHDRPPEDDRRHLHALRRAAGRSAPFLFNAGALNAITQTIAWCVIFFFASAGASSAYLTVSEIFPLEVRAKAIAVFFAIAQCFGAIGPVLYGALIGDGSDPSKLFFGYLIGAGVMIVGGLVAVVPRRRRRGQVAGGRRHAAGRRGRRQTQRFRTCGGCGGPRSP